MLLLFFILSCAQRNPVAAVVSVNRTNEGLTSVPDDIDPNVTTLLLSINQIKVINNTDFNNKYSDLDDLHMDRNKIKTIEKGSFRGLPLGSLHLGENLLSEFPDLRNINGTLKELNLSSNLIEEISEEDINYLGALEQLYLSDNPINTLPDLNQLLPALKVLIIELIQFHCCNNISFLKDVGLTVYIDAKPCASPPSFNGRQWSSITHEELSNTRCGEFSFYLC